MWAPCKGIQISGSGRFLLVESGILGFGIWNVAKESGISLKIGIWNPSSTDKENGIQYLETGIHGVESRIQDCLGFPYMGRLINQLG